MKKCEILKTVTITVQAGSQVIISDKQYGAIKACSGDILKEISDTGSYKNMSKAELITLAKERNKDVSASMTKEQLISLLEG